MFGRLLLYLLGWLVCLEGRWGLLENSRGSLVVPLEERRDQAR